MLKSAIIVEGYPAVFPNVDMSTRMNIPVKKRLKRFDTTMDAFPDPRGVLNVFRFVGAREGKVFAFKNRENRRICSCKNLATIFSKECEVENVQVFESDTSFFGFEVKKVPVNPMDFGVSISFP